MLVNCKLTLVEWFTKNKLVKTITPKDPIKACEIHSKSNPMCIATIEWNDSTTGKSKTYSVEPYNMAVDLMAVENMEMSIDKYTRKWYGKISKAKLKAIEKELAAEFVEDTEEEEVEEVIED
jgi:hypothetical protein